MNTERALQKLGQEVAKELDEMADKAILADVRRRLVEPTSPRARGRTRPWAKPVAIGLPVLAAAAAFVLFFSPGGSNELAFEVGEPPTPGVVGAWTTGSEARAVPIQFDDGARFEVASAGRTRVGASSQDEVWLIHEAGALSGVVVGGDDGARYRLTAGPFEAKTQRAKFDLSWDPDTGSLELTVHSGSVMVFTPQSRDGVSVEAGRRIKANTREERLELGSTAPPAPSAPATEE
jgi:hypothetical protein